MARGFKMEEVDWSQVPVVFTGEPNEAGLQVLRDVLSDFQFKEYQRNRTRAVGREVRSVAPILDTRAVAKV